MIYLPPRAVYLESFSMTFFIFATFSFAVASFGLPEIGLFSKEYGPDLNFFFQLRTVSYDSEVLPKFSWKYLSTNTVLVFISPCIFLSYLLQPFSCAVVNSNVKCATHREISSPYVYINVKVLY